MVISFSAPNAAPCCRTPCCPSLRTADPARTDCIICLRSLSLRADGWEPRALYRNIWDSLFAFVKQVLPGGITAVWGTEQPLGAADAWWIKGCLYSLTPSGSWWARALPGFGMSGVGSEDISPPDLTFLRSMSPVSL